MFLFRIYFKPGPILIEKDDIFGNFCCCFSYFSSVRLIPCFSDVGIEMVIEEVNFGFWKATKVK